jgi:LysR family nitrogen assimilation transcriptional regulator
MDLKELRYFLEVARAGSFLKAAENLRIAQPALSRKVRKLERELGAELLIRHGRGIRLTNAGSRLVTGAEQIAQLVTRTTKSVHSGDNEPTGHIVLGVPPAAGLLLVPALIETFRARAPMVSLHIREGISSSLQEWLLDQRLDVAMLHNPAALQSIDTAPLLTERMVVIGPRQGRDRPPDGTRFRIRDLAALPLIMPSLPHNNRRILEQAALQHGAALNVALEVDSVPLTKELVRHGLGFSIITFAAVQDDIRRKQLNAYPIDRPPLLSTIAIAHARGPQQPHVQELVAVMRDTVQKLVRDGRWQGARTS